MKRILLVQSNSQLLGTMIEYLKDHYRVESCLHADQALRILQNNPFDLVVMPYDPAGDDLNRMARAASTAAMICVVENLNSDAERHLLEMGIDQFLTMPFELESLKLRIDHLMGRLKLVRRLRLSEK